MKEPVIFHFGRFRLSPATRELSRNGEVLAVPARVFDCLSYLIEHRSRAVGRDELGAAIWGRADVSEAQLTQTVLRTRRLLGTNATDQVYIRTVPRFGYHWVGTLCEEGEASPTSHTLASTSSAHGEVGHHELKIETTAATTRSGTSRVKWIAIGFAVMTAATVAVGSWTRKPSAPPYTAGASVAQSALVLPIDNLDGGDDYAWIRLGAIEVIARRIRAAGLAVPPTETTLALLKASGEQDTKALLRNSGTHWVIRGHVNHSTHGWRVVLEATDRTNVQLTASAEAFDLLATVRGSTDLLLRQMGRTPAAAPDRSPVIAESLQRAQAAMLENDFASAQRILTTSLTTKSDEPELRYQLAILAFRAGRLKEAEAELQPLVDDKVSTGNPQRRSQIHYFLGAIAMMRDHAADAEHEFSLALEPLNRQQDPLDFGKALGGRGGARLTLGRYSDGFDDLGAARILLEQSGDRLALARINATFGIALLLRDHAAQAIPLLTSALSQLAPFGAINERAHTYSALCNAQLQLLDYAAASKANQAALALLTQISDPLNRAETLLDRLSLLLVEGHLGEMLPVVANLDALDLADQVSLDGRRDSLHAQLDWTRGDAAQALARAEAAIRKLKPKDPDAAAKMVLLRQRALISLGRREQAEALLKAYVVPDDRLPIDLHVARAELAVADGALIAADREFKAALADAESLNLPAATLRVAISMVPYLLAKNDTISASEIIGRLGPVASQDFNAALLKVRVHQAMGRVQASNEALQEARRLAGERAIPPELEAAPSLRGSSATSRRR